LQWIEKANVSAGYSELENMKAECLKGKHEYFYMYVREAIMDIMKADGF
jgi:hypothetical protein